MLVICIKQCDVLFGGKGHPADRTKALFEGIEYEIPDDAAERLIASGHVMDASAPAGAESAAPPIVGASEAGTADELDLTTLTANDLRELARSRGLSMSGPKAALIARITEAPANAEHEDGESAGEGSAEDSEPAGGHE